MKRQPKMYHEDDFDLENVYNEDDDFFRSYECV